ncbi:MAG: bL21 family ribosomal protein [Thermoguttaceae bacterium]|nr:bL21 family ribosomal protein [Thermoguttaceae bacterium]
MGNFSFLRRFLLRRPTISGAKNAAEAPTKEKGPKLGVRWLRRRKNSRKKNGRRQTYIKVEIKEIVEG